MVYEKGQTFEELKVGDTAFFSKTISETDIYLFAGISGDFNPIHVNEFYASSTIFNSRIAHGPLVQSLIAPVLGTILPGVGTIAIELSCRFRKPVYIGDTVIATATVVEKLEEKKWIRLSLDWVNQNSIVVAQGSALVMPPR